MSSTGNQSSSPTLRLPRTYSLLLATLALTACSTVPLTSLPKLMRLDPETVDFADLAMGASYPEGFELVGDTTRIFIGFTDPATDTLVSEAMEFRLASDEVPPRLARERRRGRKVGVYAVSAGEVARMESFRTRLLAARGEGDEKLDGSFSASVFPCALEQGLTFADFRPTLYLRTDPDGEFFTLFRKMDFKTDDPAPLCSEVGEDDGAD